MLTRRLLKAFLLPQPATTLAHFNMSSSTAYSAHINETEENRESSNDKAPLAIEAPPPASEQTNEIKVDGDAVKLDVLGPMVINTDGTISRVNNWHQMTEHEQASTRRLLVKRNEARRKALLEKGV
ncbi:hypothetical protein B0O99DRAFT_622003 [Bisporella sp. PMI_857]|nr:hypothetical protein B0O99DRAFT_622003 [Bisporella sp. PMI_857]